MRRENTIVFGSQMGTASPPDQRNQRNHARTDTLVDERRVNGLAPSNQPPAPAPTPSSMAARPRYVSEPGPVSAPAPVSSRAESQWFAPTNPRLAPVGHEVFEERRGWQPPPASRGLMFTAVSVLLVGVAAAGTFFLLGPNENRSHSATPVSTTTITNAEIPTTPASAPAAEPPLEPAAPMMLQTVTPNDLPSAPPVVDAVKEPAGGQPEKTTAASPKPKTTAATPAARNPRSVAPAKAATAPAKSKKSEGSLPDLDRAATAAGMTPQQDDPFATPGTETPPAPAATSTPSTAPATTATSGVTEPSGGAMDPSVPSTSTPSGTEVMPDLQIKR